MWITFTTTALLFSVLQASQCSETIRKCCPRSQQLDSSFHRCLRQDRRNVSNNPFLPWWANNETIFGSSFLEEQNASQFIHFGVRQPCDISEATVFNLRDHACNLLLNGSLIYQNTDKDIMFPPNSYCVDQVALETSDNLIVAVLCPCFESNCIRKCCPSGEILCAENDNLKCVVSNDDIIWNPLLSNYSFTNKQFTITDNNIKLSLQCTDHPMNTASLSGFVTWVLTDSTVLSNKETTVHRQQYYCADWITTSNTDTILPAMMFCSVPSKSGALFSLYTVSLPISATLLAITLLVFLVVPEIRNTKSRIVICHVVSLLITYTGEAVGRRLRPVAAQCYTLFFIDQYFYLSSIFWLNVLCFDIACTFRDMRPTRMKTDGKNFLYYSLYAWGTPAINSIIIAVTEFTEVIDYLKPGITSREECGIANSAAAWFFEYGPIIALSSLNCVFLVYTVTKIVRAQCSTSILNKGNTHNKKSSCLKRKAKTMVYINLLCLLGPPRLILVTIWGIQGSSTTLSILGNLVEMLRAASIFIFVCCKPRLPSLFVQNARALCTGNKRRKQSQNCPNITITKTQTTKL